MNKTFLPMSQFIDIVFLGCNNTDYINSLERGFGNRVHYHKYVIGLYFDSFTHNNAGYVREWELSLHDVDTENIITTKGKTIVELIDIFRFLKTHWNLHSKSKDIVLVYVEDSLNKYYGFLKNYNVVNSVFIDKYFNMLGVFEFRTLKSWTPNIESIRKEFELDKTYTNSQIICCKAHQLYNEVFINNSQLCRLGGFKKKDESWTDRQRKVSRRNQTYFFLSPNQKTRKTLAWSIVDKESTIGNEIWPMTWWAYNNLRSTLYGGLNYITPYSCKTIKDDVIDYDRKSAYIYELMCNKHCVTASKMIKDGNNTWRDYVMTEEYKDVKMFYGLFEITFVPNKKYSKIIRLYDADKSKSMVRQMYNKETTTVTIWLTDIDVRLWHKFVTIKDIKCGVLYEADLDYLPEYVIDVLYQEYMKKESLNNNIPARNLQKKVVNGIYGDCIRRVENIIDFNAEENLKQYDEFRKMQGHTDEEWNNFKINNPEAYRRGANEYIYHTLFRTHNKYYSERILCPQWGILATARCREMLFNLGTELDEDTWLYSDTDSVYCKDTLNNQKVIAKYNKIMLDNVKEFCNHFNGKYEYETIQNIGQFVPEHYITKFKAFKQKIYAFKTKDAKDNGEERMYLKAAGCDQTRIDVDDHIFDDDYVKLDYGYRVIPKFNPNTTSCVVDGVKYTSNGSYYEERCGLVNEIQGSYDMITDLQ